MSVPMELVAVYPDPPPPDLARTLDLAGYGWKAVGRADEIGRDEPTAGWAGAVVSCDGDPEGAWSFCRALRKRAARVPLPLLVSGSHLADLELRDDLYDDFCITPFHPIEVEARLRHLFAGRNGESSAEGADCGGQRL